MRIDTSIQDFVKKINSHIFVYVSLSELITLFLFSLSLLTFSLVLVYVARDERHIFVYHQNPQSTYAVNTVDSKKALFFSAKKGKVYYYSWCKAGARVKEKNRLYFESEESVKGSGRKLSHFCE